jgi:hypothetical protein
LHWGGLHPEFLFGKGANYIAMEVFDTTTDTNAELDFEPAATGHIIPTPGSPAHLSKATKNLKKYPDLELQMSN